MSEVSAFWLGVVFFSLERGGGGGSAKPSKKLTLMMCSNCTNFTHVPFAQYLHHLILCHCVEGNVKSTELSLKVVFYLSPSSVLFREQCRFE